MLRKLWTKIMSGKSSTPGRHHHQQKDTAMACILTEYWKRKSAESAIIDTHQASSFSDNKDLDDQTLFQQTIADLEKLSLAQQQNHIHECLEEQIQSIFRSYQSAAFESPTSVQTSRIPDAGKGVFVQTSSIGAGTVLGFFPGSVYLAQHVQEKKYQHQLNGNPYIRGRYDQIVIDASSSKSLEYGKIGQYINHPPAGSSANVMPVAFDFPDVEFFQNPSYRHMVPNEYVEPPPLTFTFGKNILMPSIVLIALRNISAGEELYLNYRYNPAFPFPDWYSPVDRQEDEQLWSS